jgi:16S rRNA (adenine1518-N6/adenine1519-N6)-dimethyltransferase
MSQKLGQHFLKNKGKIRKIADSLDLKEGDFIVEIGPGHGELTRELIAVPNVKVIAVEKDKSLALKLKENFEFRISNFKKNSNDKNSKPEVIQGDALKILPSLIQNSKLKTQNSGYKVAGNIPYYITGKLLRVLGELVTGVMTRHNIPPISLVVLMVQKEVAERLTAKPPKMNLLAASVQFWASPEIIDYISRKDFSPPPKVDSAIIKLITKNQQLTTDENYYKLIKILFKQPRKTILNNLAGGLGKEKKEITEALGRIGINPLDRPQNLSVEKINKLAKEQL